MWEHVRACENTREHVSACECMCMHVDAFNIVCMHVGTCYIVCACACTWHVHMCACVCACAGELTSNIGMWVDIEVVASQPATNEDNFQFVSTLLHGFYDVSATILHERERERERERKRGRESLRELAFIIYDLMCICTFPLINSSL